MKLFAILLLSLLGIIAAPVSANNAAQIIYFEALSTCFDEAGNFLLTTTERKLVITNNGKGTVNLVAKGQCPTTAMRAVYWDHRDFPGLGCNGGVTGIQPYWKYHMRPDGKYTLKCQSHKF